eukprot:3438561-Alexandrium_andersonii.AAC.1
MAMPNVKMSAMEEAMIGLGCSRVARNPHKCHAGHQSNGCQERKCKVEAGAHDNTKPTFGHVCNS